MLLLSIREHGGMFIATLFTVGKTWKQSRCPSTDERIKKLWCIYTMQYYSTIKRHIGVNSSEVDEPSSCYREGSKSDREKQILCINTLLGDCVISSVLSHHSKGLKWQTSDSAVTVPSFIGQAKESTPSRCEGGPTPKERPPSIVASSFYTFVSSHPFASSPPWACPM